MKMIECDACKLIDLLNAMEYGFKEHEKGNNLDTARRNFVELMKNG
jgi:hypothetical protein